MRDGDVRAPQVTDRTERSMEVRALVSVRASGAAFGLRRLIREEMVRLIGERWPDAFPRLRVDGPTPTPALAESHKECM